MQRDFNFSNFGVCFYLLLFSLCSQAHQLSAPPTRLGPAFLHSQELDNSKVVHRRLALEQNAVLESQAVVGRVLAHVT